MLTCGSIVFPNLLEIQYLQNILDFNDLDQVEIFKSMSMIINW